MAHKKIDFLFFDAGSGHREAAVALATAVGAARPDWRARTVNLLELLEHNRSFARMTGAAIDYFNRMLKKDRVFDLRGLVRLGLLGGDLVSKRGIAQIAEHWTAAGAPDAVVSVTPIVGALLHRAVRHANPDATTVTVPVDMEEGAPRYWFERRSASHYLVGTARLAEQAKKARIPAERIHRIDGMVIRPEFYAQTSATRAEVLTGLGLDPSLPTALISFGGQGSVLASRTARALAAQRFSGNVVFLCGRNEALRAELTEAELPYGKAVLGFTPEAPSHYYRAADVVVGKPGTMTITEAVVVGTPLVLLKSRGMRPVQGGNEAWVENRGVGLVVDGPAGVPEAVVRVTTSSEFRERTRFARHDGVFDATKHIVTLTEGTTARPEARLEMQA